MSDIAQPGVRSLLKRIHVLEESENFLRDELERTRLAWADQSAAHLKRVQELEATVVALREGLRAIQAVCEGDVELIESDYDDIYNIYDPLLASPNPGERVQGVLQAVVDWATTKDDEVYARAELTMVRYASALKGEPDA